MFNSVLESGTTFFFSQYIGIAFIEMHTYATGIFYMQHWINTVKLLTAVEQACLFLNEMEKTGSFIC